MAQANSWTKDYQDSVGSLSTAAWTSALEQIAGNLQAVTDRRVVEDMDYDERQAYVSLLRAYGAKRRAIDR